MRNNIGNSHYVQLMAYAAQAERNGWYYGRKEQFDKRHKQIVLFLIEAIQKSDRKRMQNEQ